MTAYTPNLPALITALPGDHTRAPQESDAAGTARSGPCPQCASPLPGAEPVPTSAEGVKFTRERQVLFLENLSLTDSVRSAAAAAGVSHQTAYRARRGNGQFRLAWDAALVTARANAEVVLAARAIDGVEEKVFYHGEEVATRTRYSDRLLLAHLGRLDRLTADAHVNAFAEDFDAALARFERGEEVLPVTPAADGKILSPEPCNTRSMSPAPDEDLDEDDDVDWDDEEAAEAELVRIEAAMDADRPADAPRLDADDPHGLIADAQHEAFVRGVPRWWLVVPPAPWGGEGRWHYAGEENPVEEEPAAEDELADENALLDEAVDGCESDDADVQPEPEPAPEHAPENTAETAPPLRTWRGPSEGAQPFYGRACTF